MFELGNWSSLFKNLLAFACEVVEPGRRLRRTDLLTKS